MGIQWVRDYWMEKYTSVMNFTLTSPTSPDIYIPFQNSDVMYSMSKVIFTFVSLNSPVLSYPSLNGSSSPTTASQSFLP